MHLHHSDTFETLEFGIRFAERHDASVVVNGVAGGGAATTVTPPPAEAPADTPEPAPNTTGTSTSAEGPDAVDKGEAIKDATEAAQKVIENGKVTDKEVEAITQAADGQAELGKAAVDQVQQVLEDKVGAMDDAGGAHDNTVKSIKALRPDDQIQADIDKFKKAGAEEFAADIQALEAEQNKRDPLEDKLVDDIKTKEQLGAANVLEQQAIEESKPDVTSEEYKAKAQGAIDNFAANNGQMYDGSDLFGDNWDTLDKPLTADDFFKRIEDDPGILDGLPNAQGEHDDSINDTEPAEGLDNFQTYYEQVKVRDPAAAAEIKIRYEAALDLQEIGRNYLADKEKVKAADAQIAAITTEQQELRASIDSDKALLSPEGLTKLDKALAGEDHSGGYVMSEEDRAIGQAQQQRYIDEMVARGQSAGADGGAGGGTGDAGGTGGTGDAGGTGGSTGGAGDAGGTQAPTPVQIDYTTPENQQIVLTKAQEQNLLPAANTTFNAQGDAVYTVQQGDSYWRIADQSDGKPSDQFDVDHFITTRDTNSAILGRDPQVGEIRPDEQIVIANRNINELIRLLNLPTTEEGQG